MVNDDKPRFPPTKHRHCGERFISADRLSNFELRGLRENGWPRRTRWYLMWDSLSIPNHPKDREENRAYKERVGEYYGY